jgi:uncharacterized protein (DUF2252 family)
MEQQTLLPISEQRSLGHAERRRVAPEAHADWSVPNARDLLKLVTMRDANRIPELLPERNRRMSRSPLAFLRGADTVMAADLANTPRTKILVQACGDCHLMNFGAYFTPEGHPVFDVNDFDETHPAPFEWDLKRLAASLAQAGHEVQMSDRACRKLAHAMVAAYTAQIKKLAARPPIETWYSQIDLGRAIRGIDDNKLRHAETKRLRLIRAAGRQHLKIVRFGKHGPQLVHDDPCRMWKLPAADHQLATDAFDAAKASLPPERRALLDRYQLKDVAFKMVGVGSVGTFCVVVLLATPDNDPLLLQIKAAEMSALAPHLPSNTDAHQGERVVIGQRMMQATPDIFLAAARVESTRDFYLRRLKDTRLAKISDKIGGKNSLHFRAKLCALALARAHSRSGAAPRIQAYIGEDGAFADAVAAFGIAYAAQTRADHSEFCAAVFPKFGNADPFEQLATTPRTPSYSLP